MAKGIAACASAKGGKACPSAKGWKGCVSGPWIKARKCSDDTVVNIGFTNADALAFWAAEGTSGGAFGPFIGYFKYSGVCYYITSSDSTVSTAPGTVLAYGSVPTYRCCSECNSGASCCAGCSGGAAVPRSVQVVLSSHTTCAPGCYGFISGSLDDIEILSSGDNNGVYCLPLVSVRAIGDNFSGCLYACPLLNPVTFNRRGNNGGVGTCTGAIRPGWTNKVIDILTVFLEFSAFGSTGYAEVTARESRGVPNGYALPDSIGVIFVKAITPTSAPNCVDFTASNQITACGDQNIHVGGSIFEVFAAGHDGTAAVVMNGC